MFGVEPAVRDLEGKTALVTGGTRGIGRAVSLNLARRGANVVVGYFRNRGAAQETTSLIEEHGVKAVTVRGHLGDENNIAALFDKVAETFGRLDVFVSNAASGVIKPVSELDAKGWDWTMNVNARPLLLGAIRAKELMGGGGSIVALSSLGSQRVLPGYAVVGASKAAIESIVRYLAVELAPDIRVNAVSPGVIDTDALKHFPMREQMLSHALGTTPGGRLVTPEDVAGTVDFLTSEAAAMVTGQVLVVDGGQSLLA